MRLYRFANLSPAGLKMQDNWQTKDQQVENAGPGN